MPIPADDDITKTELWKRIDAVFPIIANVKEELYPQILGVKEIAMAAIKNEIDGSKAFIQAFESKMESRLDTYTKEISTIIFSAVDKLQKENQKNIASLEEKIRHMQANIPSLVVQEAKAHLSPVQTRMHEVSKEVEIFKKSHLEMTGKFQSESIGKITALNTKLEDVLKKFKQLTSTFR
jgi:vacuolar-type H+-ATPase subunit H